MTQIMLKETKSSSKKISLDIHTKCQDLISMKQKTKKKKNKNKIAYYLIQIVLGALRCYLKKTTESLIAHMRTKKAQVLRFKNRWNLYIKINQSTESADGGG